MRSVVCLVDSGAWFAYLMGSIPSLQGEATSRPRTANLAKSGTTDGAAARPPRCEASDPFDGLAAGSRERDGDGLAGGDCHDAGGRREHEAGGMLEMVKAYVPAVSALSL